MGGGGDNGAYEAKQAQIEAEKDAARARVNALFGEGTGAPVSRETYTSAGPLAATRNLVSGSGDGDPYYEDTLAPSTVFDQAAYDKAVAGNTSDVAAAKAAREAIYTGVRDNAYTAGKRGLDETREAAQRNLKFELFAKGLNGGSEDVNQNALLGRTYDQGILDLGAKADAAATGLRTSDEQSRLGLLSAINQGTDATSALSSAANQLQNNSANAAATAQGTTLGNLFDNAGLLYQKSQYSQGKAAGTDWWNTLNPTTTTGSTKKSVNGITTARSP